MSELLQISRLTKRFGGLVAVNDVSFSVREGEILSVTAFELPVAQVIDSNTLMVDLSALNEEELGRLPLDTPLRLEVLRYRDSRFSELVLDLRRYAVRGVPLLGWEPSPDQQATEQIVERLNQWLRQTGATVAWTPDSKTAAQSARPSTA